MGARKSTSCPGIIHCQADFTITTYLDFLLCEQNTIQLYVPSRPLITKPETLDVLLYFSAMREPGPWGDKALFCGAASTNVKNVLHKARKMSSQSKTEEIFPHLNFLILIVCARTHACIHVHTHTGA